MQNKKQKMKKNVVGSAHPTGTCETIRASPDGMCLLISHELGCFQHLSRVIRRREVR
jgi:hypothetical protein